MIALIVSMSICLDSFGQSIKGHAQDKHGNGLPFANVLLLNVSDSTLAKGAVCDSSGFYLMQDVRPGTYFLSARMLGYMQSYSGTFNITAGQSIEMISQLQKGSQQLEEVVITGDRPFIEHQPDRTVINVAGSIIANGTNALEVLEKSPGVTVDTRNDVLRLRGREGVIVQINGKQTYLSMTEVVALLRGMSSENIDQVHLIANPSANHDAAGNAGIIDIRLKKNDQFGSNGSVSSGMVLGITAKGNGAASLNYRNERVNVFANIAGTTGKYLTDILAYRIQRDSIYDQTLLQVSKNRNFNAKMGADLFLTGKHTLGIMLAGNFGEEHWKSSGNTFIYHQPTYSHIKNLVAFNTIPRKRTMINTNLNYRYNNGNGKEINFDLDYGLFEATSKSYQPNFYRDKTGELTSQTITRNNTPTDIDIYTARIDFIRSISGSRFAFGAKSSYVATDNIFDFFIDENGYPAKVLSRSYGFNYEENVNAAYVDYQYNGESKFSIKTGLRVEQTRSEGILNRADGEWQATNTAKRSYADLFPNVALSWTVNQKNLLSLTYGRRIDRPTYQDLNPFEIQMDELTYVKGNAFLKPQYTDNLVLAQTWNTSVHSEVGFSHIKDHVTLVNDTVGNNTFVQQQNLATKKILSFALSSPFQISKRWEAFVSLWFNYQILKGRIDEKPLDVAMPVYGASMRHSFTMGNDYGLELVAWYNGPFAPVATWHAKAMGAVDVGIQKPLFEKRATLKISATDIFRTSIPFRGKTDFGGLYMNVAVTTESQTVRISFSYRFGNSKIRSASDRTGSLESESKRIKEN